MTTTSELRRDLPIFEIYTGANGDRIELHPWFFVAGKQYLGLTRILPPGTGKGPAHVHTGITQYSFLLAGPSARYRRGLRAGTLKTGDALVIPPGAAHVDPYNDTDEPVVVRTVYTPGPVWLMSYGKTLGQAVRDGNVNAQHELRPAHLLLMLGTPGSVTFAARVPLALQRRVMLPLATRIARRRGYAPAAGLRGHIFR
ncbi:cupin domain-containing protein [Nocardia huaxiensis]|uniref:Cupin domain-containing protein n=1 Tax=Nocardia huaxiensis TaxID=2755382 RepID=A0A7D6VFB6_9NOCA|nr:cupin domain-containing protein [Nocardia huaxiensis]QLY28270.1 cupin domain-containing protein [Nocardia huaxiensis]UFS98293.1 cupin domain-containing protein [Nocardia huaxiensis]